MFQKFFHAAAAVLALLSTLGCAAQLSQLPPGVIFTTTPHQVYQFNGMAGNDQPDGLVVPVPLYCASRAVRLQAEFSTPMGVRGGRESYHGVHADYELRSDNQTSWARNWEEAPSPAWREINKSWPMPANMQWAKIRLMLQGVSGPLLVRNVMITC